MVNKVFEIEIFIYANILQWYVWKQIYFIVTIKKNMEFIMFSSIWLIN